MLPRASLSNGLAGYTQPNWLIRTPCSKIDSVCRIHLTKPQRFCESLIVRGRFVDETRNSKGRFSSRFSSAGTHSLERTPSRLANWPPPYRSAPAKPKIVRHPPTDKPTRAKQRGWRLTRAMFSEFEEDT